MSFLKPNQTCSTSTSGLMIVVLESFKVCVLQATPQSTTIF